jgi:hypothetical protein
MLSLKLGWRTYDGDFVDQMLVVTVVIQEVSSDTGDYSCADPVESIGGREKVTRTLGMVSHGRRSHFDVTCDNATLFVDWN